MSGRQTAMRTRVSRILHAAYYLPVTAFGHLLLTDTRDGSAAMSARVVLPP